MIARLMIPGLVALLVAAAPLPAQEEEKAAHLGTYTYVKGMKGDQPVPEEDLKQNSVEIEEGKLALVGPDGTDQFVITYVVDETAEDGTIKVSMEIVESSLFEEAVGSKAKAIGKHEGDTITLIYDFGGGDYPADFEPDGPTQHLFVIKKKPASGIQPVQPETPE